MLRYPKVRNKECASIERRRIVTPIQVKDCVLAAVIADLIALKYDSAFVLSSYIRLVQFCIFDGANWKDTAYVCHCAFVASLFCNTAPFAHLFHIPIQNLRVDD